MRTSAPSLTVHACLSAALAAGAIAVIAGCASSSSPSSGASKPAPASTSPPLSPSPVPTTSTPASSPASSPGSTGVGTPVICRTSALRVKVGASNGTAGTIYYNLDFTNAGATACILQGYPGVSLVTAGNNSGSQIGADAKRSGTVPVRAIVVSPGQTAHAVLGVAEAANFPASKCNPVTAHWLKAFPPGMRAAAYASFTTQTCASTAEPTMTITAITSGA